MAYDGWSDIDVCLMQTSGFWKLGYLMILFKVVVGNKESRIVPNDECQIFYFDLHVTYTVSFVLFHLTS